MKNIFKFGGNLKMNNPHFSCKSNATADRFFQDLEKSNRYFPSSEQEKEKFSNNDNNDNNNSSRKFKPFKPETKAQDMREINRAINDPNSHNNLPNQKYDPTSFNIKTKACSNIKKENEKYTNCSKPECTYAHFKEELVLKECLYGDKCKRFTDARNPCTFFHAKKETDKQYYSRTRTTEPDLPSMKDTDKNNLKGSWTKPLKL